MAYVKVAANETLPELVQRVSSRSDVDSIRNHPKNAPLFRSRSAYVLKTGDQIWIPDDDPPLDWFSVAIGEELALVAEGTTRPFKVVVRGPDRAPIANQPCKLTVDGADYTGTTAADGTIELRLPVKATHAVVSAGGYSQAIVIGGLEPIHTAKGIQGRLRNLGYAVGVIDGVFGIRTIEAIKAFQRDNGLEVDGKAGPVTRSKLQEVHGL